MTSNPVDHIGRLHAWSEELIAWVQEGTCFGFVRDGIALTAAHNVLNAEANYVVIFPQHETVHDVIGVIVHPTADIAILNLALSGEAKGAGISMSVFSDGTNVHRYGDDFHSFGFPSDSPEGAGKTPSRMYKGYLQRIFKYGHHEKWTYLASELSVPAPLGLSGAPIYSPTEPDLVMGLVTANVESYTVGHYEEKVEEDGQRTLFEARHIITYGVALLLSNVADWLGEHLSGNERPMQLQQSDE
ncbi:trypsin-like peptidase domain-containing protein [Frondihabitans sp. 4ASC-45]|uniref:trypsin-like peptidase domain-containing protein n=1 Tax=Frondihabitans sp. 4ASC-45 TaxID=3111636 RepID=UPI003C143C01